MKVGPYTLDEYQERAVNEVRASLAAGGRRILLEAPTGTGKTVIAMAITELSARRGTRVGFITSGRQLIYQMARKAEESGLDYSVLMANSRYEWNPDAQCLIISKDTLDARRGKMYWNQPDIYIVDECDVCLSEKWRKLLKKSRYTVGLTATPVSGKGEGLGFYYDSMVKVAKYSELIESGRLVDITKCFSPYRPDLVGGKKSGGDWNQHWLGERMNRQRLVGDIVQHWQRLGEDRPTVAFCVDKKHTAAVCEAFKDAGVPSEYILDETTQFERDEIFKRVELGETKVLVNCATLTRGWDLPCVSCCILAKPTRRVRLYLQMVGRVLRAHHTKDDAILIDHSGSVWEHGWPTEDREWTREGGEPREQQRQPGEQGEQPERLCPQCGLILPGYASSCTNCGWKRLQREQMAEAEDGTLRSVKKRERTSQEKLQREWTGLLFAFARSGKRYKQAAAVFKGKTGQWPDDAKVYPLAAPHQRSMLVSEWRSAYK